MSRGRLVQRGTYPMGWIDDERAYPLLKPGIRAISDISGPTVTPITDTPPPSAINVRRGWPNVNLY